MTGNTEVHNAEDEHKINIANNNNTILLMLAMPIVICCAKNKELQLK